MPNTIIDNGVISAVKLVTSESITTPALTANNSLIYKGQELTDILDNTKTELEDTFVKLEGGNEITGNQTITGELTVTEDSESSGFPGQPYFFDTPSEMLCDAVYDLGILTENKDLSNIKFADISTHVQTCEIWFETGETVYTVTWPLRTFWPDEINGVYPPSLTKNTAYRYAIRREPNGIVIVTKAYSYPV